MKLQYIITFEKDLKSFKLGEVSKEQMETFRRDMLKISLQAHLSKLNEELADEGVKMSLTPAEEEIHVPPIPR